MVDSLENLRVVEFYSGIGGMHCALNLAMEAINNKQYINNSNNENTCDHNTQHFNKQRKKIHAHVVKAFEINHVANKIYQANFSIKPEQRGIEGVSPKQLDKYCADVWLMSPPCQPYSRQGKKKDIEDPRAKSFLHLVSALEIMKLPPTFILLENVVGFDTSISCLQFKTQLHRLGYTFQQFILSPHQFQIPNIRRRYFLLAKKNAIHF